MIREFEQEVTIASKLSIEFSKVAKRITKCYIAVGMITDHMLDFTIRQMETCTECYILCGVHMTTTPTVMSKLQILTKSNKLKSGVYTKQFFHSKLYLFRTENEWIAFVGSGNFTDGGWRGNEELFVKITNQESCAALLDKFNTWFRIAEPITDNFIDLYTQNYFSNTRLEKEKIKNTNALVDKLHAKFNIENVDFNDQFFKKDDVLAFQPGKTHLDTPDILAERKLMSNKLYLLNSMLVAKMPPAWELVPHYKNEHIVSNIETRHHHDDNVRSLWVGYGRGETQLKRYDKYAGSNNTPLFFMRMQVIASYDKVGVWLMPGKNNAGQIDRESFASKMNEAAYAQKFFELLTGLGSPYWIEVANDLQPVTVFTKREDLQEYVSKDNWRKDYFIIGRDYELGDDSLTTNNIVETCLVNFAKYKPIYEMIRDKTFG